VDINSVIPVAGSDPVATAPGSDTCMIRPPDEPLMRMTKRD